jgi:hypothetical protein
MAAAASVEGFNYSDGDIAAPHLVYNAGQVPATLLQFQNGDSDLLTTNGRLTDNDLLHQNWTQDQEASDNDVYFDDNAAWSHILDASLFESSFEQATPPSEVSAQDGIKEDFSSLAYNVDPHLSDIDDNFLDVGITVGSWDAWYAAEEKITDGEAKDVFDDITALANQVDEMDDAYGFAFGYDEEADEFIAEETYEESEYEEMNPFEELEWPR